MTPDRAGSACSVSNRYIGILASAGIELFVAYSCRVKQVLRSTVPGQLELARQFEQTFASWQVAIMVLNDLEVLSEENRNMTSQALHAGPRGRPAVCIFGAGAVGQYLAVALEPHCRSLTLCCSTSTYNTVKCAGVSFMPLHALCMRCYSAADVPAISSVSGRRRVSFDRQLDREVNNVSAV